MAEPASPIYNPRPGDGRPPLLYRFGVFETDVATGELRRKGIRVKLHAQPFPGLASLAGTPGQMLTREEICRELWPCGTFVDYEHGLNSAINRLRDALGDKAGQPRFIETLARRGYRFLAPVERIDFEAVPAARPGTAPGHGSSASSRGNAARSRASLPR